MDTCDREKTLRIQIIMSESTGASASVEERIQKWLDESPHPLNSFSDPYVKGEATQIFLIHDDSKDIPATWAKRRPSTPRLPRN